MYISLFTPGILICVLFTSLNLILMPIPTHSHYFIKLDANCIAQLDKILGYNSFLEIPGFSGHFIHSFVFTNSNYITVAPMTSDYMLCSLLNARHYNGPIIKDFKIQHIRDNFSIYIDDLNKIPQIIQLLQNYEKKTFHNLNIGPAKYAHDVLENAKMCKNLVSQNGTLNLTMYGRATESMEATYPFNNALRLAEYPTLSMRFDINDHPFMDEYYTKKALNYAHKIADNLNNTYIYHEKLRQTLVHRMQTYTVNYPTGVAHPINGHIKDIWSLQQFRSLNVLTTIDTMKKLSKYTV